MVPTGAAEIVFDHVTKRYPGREEAAVDDLSLTVPAGDICILVGPWCAGKTTAMKMVNRLIEFDQGDIRIDGTSVLDNDVTALRRGIAYVIQHVGLFPHMTIAENIATVPRLLGWPRDRQRARVAELLDLVGLEPEYAKRYPSQLSGGQRQPVRPRPAGGGAQPPGGGRGGGVAAGPAGDVEGRAVRRPRPDHACLPPARVSPPARGST